MKYLCSLYIVAFLFHSCSKNEKDIEGVYVKIPSVYTIDSLFIYADSLQPTDVYNRNVYKYTQCFYNKNTNEVLFKNSNKWWLEDGGLKLMNFYFDADNNPDDYSHTKEAIENSEILFSTSFEGDDIIVERGVLYRKIK